MANKLHGITSLVASEIFPRHLSEYLKFFPVVPKMTFNIHIFLSIASKLET